MPSEQYKTLCLYYFPVGPPSRTVLLAAKVLGIDLNLKSVDMLKGEHLKREFLKINPEHKIPTLTDNDFPIGESRAIIAYLAEKYGKKESLYPRDLRKKAKINQLLFFDAERIMGNLSEYYGPIFHGAANFNESKMDDITEALKDLEQFLKDSEYVTGDKLTIADISIVSSVATLVFGFNLDLKPYPQIDKWFKNLKSTLPDFKEIIEDNCVKFKELLNTIRLQHKN